MSAKEAEAKVRAQLKEEFGQEFLERSLLVGQGLDGHPLFKKFDAVSDDARIVAMIKDNSAKNLIGNRTRLARVMQDLLYLHLLDADRKFMYLSPAFSKWFRETRDAVVPPTIEIRELSPLPVGEGARG